MTFDNLHLDLNDGKGPFGIQVRKDQSARVLIGMLKRNDQIDPNTDFEVHVNDSIIDQEKSFEELRLGEGALLVLHEIKSNNQVEKEQRIESTREPSKPQKEVHPELVKHVEKALTEEQQFSEEKDGESVVKKKAPKNASKEPHGSEGSPSEGDAIGSSKKLANASENASPKVLPIETPPKKSEPRIEVQKEERHEPSGPYGSSAKDVEHKQAANNSNGDTPTISGITLEPVDKERSAYLVKWQVRNASELKITRNGKLIHRENTISSKEHEGSLVIDSDAFHSLELKVSNLKSLEEKEEVRIKPLFHPSPPDSFFYPEPVISANTR